MDEKGLGDGMKRGWKEYEGTDCVAGEVEEPNDWDPGLATSEDTTDPCPM